MLFSDTIFLILPLLIIFYPIFVLPGNIVVYRLFTVLYVIKTLIISNGKIHTKFLSLFAVIVVYSFAVMAKHSISLSLSIAFDALFAIVFVSNSLSKPNSIIQFMLFMTLSLVISGLFGFFSDFSNAYSQSFYLNGQWILVSRFITTFPDPNYLGFYINIAILFLLIFKPFRRKIVRVIIIAFLYVVLFSTLSLTGIMANMICIFTLILFFSKNRIKYIVMLPIMIACVVFLLNRALSNPSSPLYGAAIRIYSILSQSEDISFTSLTSNRFTLWVKHLTYYFNQPFVKILFGGNRITALSVDNTVFSAVSHQDIIDLLLNVGIVGFMIYLVFFVRNVLHRWKMYRITKQKIYLSLIFVKLIWLIYAFTLSMFLEPRFFILLLI